PEETGQRTAHRTPRNPPTTHAPSPPAHQDQLPEASLRLQPVVAVLELVSVGLLESFEADEGGGQREEGCEGVGAAFVAQRRAAVAGEPGHGAFDDPPVAAEALLGLDI